MPERTNNADTGGRRLDVIGIGARSASHDRTVEFRIRHCAHVVHVIPVIEEALAQREMESARALWAKAQRMIYDDQPYTFIAVPEELTALDDRFCRVTPSAISIFAHIAEWRIAPDCAP